MGSGKTEIQELLERGLHFYGLGEIDQAIGYWRKVLLLDPGNRTAAEYIEIELGNRPEASAEPAPAAPAPEPEPPPEARPAINPAFFAGQQHLLTREWDLAVRSFETAFTADPSHPLYWPHVELSRARLIRDVADVLSNRLPRLAVPMTELMRRTDITQEYGFVLSLINGDLGLDDIISLSPLPRYTTYHILHRLLVGGLIVAGNAS